MSCPQPGDNHRTLCGRGRASYHPEWSESMPWATYINGTAGRHVASLQDAYSYFKSKNMILKSQKD